MWRKTSAAKQDWTPVPDLATRCSSTSATAATGNRIGHQSPISQPGARLPARQRRPETGLDTSPRSRNPVLVYQRDSGDRKQDWTPVSDLATRCSSTSATAATGNRIGRQSPISQRCIGPAATTGRTCRSGRRPPVRAKQQRLRESVRRNSSGSRCCVWGQWRLTPPYFMRVSLMEAERASSTWMSPSTSSPMNRV